MSGKKKKKRLDDSDEDSDSDFEPMTRSIASLTVATNSESKEPNQSVQKTVKKRKLTPKIAQVTKKEKSKKSEESPEDEKDKYENLTVICKLNRICKNKLVYDEIQDTCRVMKQIQMEAWHVANLHLLRCLQEKKDKMDLPKLEQMFFYKCAVGVLGNSVSDPDLNTTLEIYREGRAQVNGYRAPSLVPISAIVGELACQMRVNTQVMITHHFQRRLTQYLQFHDEMTYSDAKELARGCCWNKDEYNEDERRIHEWLGFRPTKFNLQRNMQQALRKLYEILSWMEANSERLQNTRGFRMFSLLPISRTFAFAHVTINASTLHGIFSRIFKKCKNDPEYSKKHKKDLADLIARGLKASEKYFQGNPDTVLRKVFDLKGLETKGKRRFGCQVTTNGYAASVLLRWLKPKVIEEKKEEEEEEGESQLPLGYSANQVIGIDPGMREFCTAMSEGVIPFVRNERMQRKRDRFLTKISETPKPPRRRPRKRSKRQIRRRRQRRAQGLLPRRRRQAQEPPRRRQRRLPNDIESQCRRVVWEEQRFPANQVKHQISTREFRHKAGMNKFRYWHENLKRRNQKYASAIGSIPSFKTASYDTYGSSLGIFWMHVNYLIKFCEERSFRKWRFFQKRMRMKVLTEMAKRLVPIPSKQVCIAYGDWSRRDRIGGHAPAPVKGFKKELAKRATVISMDEYRTSMLCSDCFRPLTPEVIANAPQRNVRRCTNHEQGARIWDRDINAARNILQLLRNVISRTPRIREFCRGIELPVIA